MSDRLKELAARRAVDYVGDDMVVGLGSGTTAEFAIRALGERVASGLRIECVATSEASARLGREVDLKVGILDAYSTVDLTIDGADEVDGRLDLIKGLGGALLREKIVAGATTEEIIIVDSSKLVDRLGTRGPLPVEVVPYGWSLTRRRLLGVADRVVQRLIPDSDEPFSTDNGNYIFHCEFDGGIVDASATEQRIDAIPGVVECGLFVDLVRRVVVAQEDGTCRILERP